MALGRLYLSTVGRSAAAASERVRSCGARPARARLPPLPPELRRADRLARRPRRGSLIDCFGKPPVLLTSSPAAPRARRRLATGEPREEPNLWGGIGRLIILLVSGAEGADLAG